MLPPPPLRHWCAWQGDSAHCVPPSRPPSPSLPMPTAAVLQALDKWKAPKWVFRTVACLVLGGQVMLRIFQGGWGEVAAGHHRAIRVRFSRASSEPLCHPAPIPSRRMPPPPPPVPPPTSGKVHWKNTAEQLKLVGPSSLGVALLTSAFVGMVFTIQFVREFAKLGLTRCACAEGKGGFGMPAGSWLSPPRLLASLWSDCLPPSCCLPPCFFH